MTIDIDAILRQRDELKRGDPDAILLFRVHRGRDCYCAFGADSIALIDLPLPEGVESWGVQMGRDRDWISFAPVDLERVLDAIVAAGRRAAVCERAGGPPPEGATVGRVAMPGVTGE